MCVCCCVLTLLSILTSATLLHNFRLNPGKGKGKDNKSKKFENGKGGKGKKHTDDETGESHKNLKKERK